jgi:hypothetical protein
MSNRDAVVSLDRVESLILSIRGRRVILDSDLARLYGVTTARLNEQVKRNPDRFSPDFMFPLSRQEFTALISQNATSKGWGGRRKLPNVFTEHGAIMAASSEMFEAKTGSCSYPYQTEFATGVDLPALVSVPTGCGKRAAVILGWLRRRRFATPEVRVANCYPASVAWGTGTNLAEVDIRGNAST